MELDRAAFSDLMQDVASTFGAADDRVAPRSSAAASTRSSSGSRCCGACSTAGPVYEPGTIAFLDRGGAPLDLHRSFALDDDPTRSDTSSPRPATCTSKVCSPRRRWPRCRPSSTTRSPPPSGTTARRGGRAPRTASGTRRGSSASTSSRRRCASCRAATASDRSGRSPTIDFVQRDPDVGDSAEGLLKKIGVVEGISDVSWHKDCSMGGHSRGCCRLTVGISVTGAGRENGELGVVAGSHRANVPCSASTASTCHACRSRRAPATSPCTARARCT